VAEPLSLGQLGRVLVRYWVLIVVGALVGGGLAFGATRLMPQVYRATAIQLVKGLPGPGAAANYEAAQYAVGRAKTYPSFVYSTPVLEGVRSDLGYAESIVQLRDDLSATNPVETPLIEVSATGPTALDAQKKANSAAKHMARFITEIETVGNRSPIMVETAVQAPLPTTAASPKTLVIVALGALIGFVLATIFALIHSYARHQRRAASRRQSALRVVGAEPASVAAAWAGPSSVAPLVPAASTPSTYPQAAAALAVPPGGLPTDAMGTEPPADPAEETDPSTKLGSEATWDLARQLAHAVSEATHGWTEWDEELFEIDPDPTTATPRITSESTTVERVKRVGSAGSGDSARSSDSAWSDASADKETEDLRGDSKPIHADEWPNGNGSDGLPGHGDEVTNGAGSTLKQSARR
jgi:capsular polysaccharide biosynthesis protein